MHRLRADAVALIGLVAEGATFIQQRIAADAIEYHVTTGLLDGDTPFKGHGHLLRLRIAGPAVTRLILPPGEQRAVLPQDWGPGG